jgi:hypothetical protein
MDPDEAMSSMMDLIGRMVPQPGVNVHVCIDKADNGYVIQFAANMPGQMGHSEVYTNLEGLLTRVKEYFESCQMVE